MLLFFSLSKKRAKLQFFLIQSPICQIFFEKGLSLQKIHRHSIHIMRKHLLLPCSILFFILTAPLSLCRAQSDADQQWSFRAQEITRNATSQYDKAKAIFDWIAHNIAYDVTFTIRDAEQAWKLRKGVCAGYSKMFVQLATHCGLEAEVISGQSRTILYPNGDGEHAWVKVKTEKGWILVDPTWGAGNVTNGRFEFVYKPYWFDVDPWWMFFTHYPETLNDQMLPMPLAREVYNKLPELTPNMAWWGWDGEQTLKYYYSQNTTPPKTFSLHDEWMQSLQVDAVPYYGELKANYKYLFKMHSNDGQFTFGITGTAQKDIFGDLSTGAEIIPKSKGTLTISIYEKNTNRIYDVLMYQVVDK